MHYIEISGQLNLNGDEVYNGPCKQIGFKCFFSALMAFDILATSDSAYGVSILLLSHMIWLNAHLHRKWDW